MAEAPTQYFGGAGPESTVNKCDWWETPVGKDCHGEVFSYIKAVMNDQAVRRAELLKHVRMYQNQGSMVASDTSSLAEWASRQRTNDKISYNLIRSCVDTATAKFAKAKPRPVFLTEDGDSAQQRRAKKLTQYTDGAFDGMKLYSKSILAFRDGAVGGTGALKFHIDENKGKINCERVLGDEVIVDDAESIYGKPQQIHHRVLASKTVLKKKFKKYRSIIETASSGLTGTVRTGDKDLIELVESWRLGVDGDMGRHSLTINGATFINEDYDKPYFPIIFWRWSPRLSGMWGSGMAEELSGTQIEIDKLLRNIQLAQHLVAVPRCFIQNGSIVGSKMDNNIGAIIEYAGAIPPTFHVPQAMSNEIYDHVRWLIQSGYERIGISQLSATSKKPAGLDYAVALREYQDIESERFMDVGQRWEEFHLEAAEIVIDLTRDLVKLKKDPKVKVAGKGFMDTIKWSDVDMREDMYIMRCFASSLLPTTPAGRYARVKDMMLDGLIPQDWAVKLLDFPDLREFADTVQASQNLAAKMIDQLLDQGQWVSPEPMMNLQQAKSLGQERYIMAKLNSVPEARCALLYRWIESINSMLPAQPQNINPMLPVPAQQANAPAGQPQPPVQG